MVSVREENNQSLKYRDIVNRYLTREELKELLKKSDFKGFMEVFKVWFWIGFSFVLVALWPNVFTVVIALILIGSKQLGCAIIMHDASHYSLFKTKNLNDLVGNWFGAYPIFHNLEQYRPYHLQHHIATGTEEDPDINLTNGYPSTKASILRKFSRDLTGISGIKGYYGLFAMHLGVLKYNLGNYIEKIVHKERGYLLKSGWRNLRGPVLANAILLGVLCLVGQPWLYLLWIGAMLTTYMFFLRVRSIAEHSMVQDRRDPLLNSRTVKANWLEQLLFAPLHVNYHQEHHLQFTVPSYNLKKMHHLLQNRGLYQKANYAIGYWSIVRMAMGR